MKLYTYWRSLATFRVRIALNLKGLAYEPIYVDLDAGQQRAAEFKAVNPQMVIPALVEDDGNVLYQSMAIMEWLEETRPQPALLPGDPRGRARVRGLALIAAADGHPLVTPRIRNYLEKTLQLPEDKRNAWLMHWTLEALKAIEGHLAKEKQTGRFCHGDSPTMADIAG